MRRKKVERRAVEQLGAQGGKALEVGCLVASALCENAVRHRAARLRLNACCIEPDGLEHISGGRDLGGLDLLVCYPHLARSRWRLSLVALWAMVWLAAVSYSVHADGSSLRYRTPVGGRLRASLPDGSFMELNTATELTVDFTARGRRVRLVKGEALFTVAHESGPFDVEVGARAIRATGAVFDVRRLAGDDVKVIVTSGRVAIVSTAQVNEIPRDRVPKTISTLRAGEEARLVSNAVNVRAIGDAADHAVGWTHGRIWLDDSTLGEAIAEFNRYHRRQVVLADPELDGLKFGGAFETADIESFVEALHHFGIEADNSDPAVLRLSKTP